MSSLLRAYSERVHERRELTLAGYDTAARINSDAEKPARNINRILSVKAIAGISLTDQLTLLRSDIDEENSLSLLKR